MSRNDNAQLNAYEAKQEARRQKFRLKATSAAEQSNRHIQSARDKSDLIPMGQPILVGHHSEKRDRNFRNSIDRDMRRGLEADDKAKHYQAKAESVGKGGVSSDDPDAVKKLQAKLENAQSIQEQMKKANAVIRKHKNEGQEAQIKALMDAVGYNEMQARDILGPDFCGRYGFPSYALSNNNANIKRLKKRIEALSVETESTEVSGDGYTCREDAEENRIFFEFPGKPSADVRSVLKSYSFKWSPARGAWVRKLTNNARAAAKAARKEIDGLAA